MASIEKAECRLKDHTFTDRFLDKLVYFYVLSLDGSFFVWIGSSPPEMSNLAAAVGTKFDKTPAGMSLFGDPMDVTSIGLAQKLAKKVDKQVFVSYSLPSSDISLLGLVERRLFQEIAADPDKF